MGNRSSKGHNYSDELRAMEQQMQAMNSSLTQSQATLTTMQNQISEKERNLQVITQNKVQSDYELRAARAELDRLSSSAKEKENKLQVIAEKKAQSDCELAAARAELTGLRSSAKEKDNKLQVIAEKKAQSDCELAAARAELDGLRSFTKEKENKLQEMIQNKEKSDRELNALRDTIANDKIRYAQGAMALLRQHDIVMNNIVVNSKGERLNTKRDLVIRILSEMRGDFENMVKWCLDVVRGNVRIDAGETILDYFNKHSGELVKEIRDIKGFVCTMRMEDNLKQQIAKHLESILTAVIDLDNKVRESRLALVLNPERFTMDIIKECLEKVEEAAWAFPLMRTIEQCIEDEKENFQQSIDSALQLSIGN